MEIYNLDKIIASSENGDQIKVNKISLFPFFVTKKYEMRLDLISYDLYGDVKYINELAYLNNLVNVFSIKEGDILFVTDSDNIGFVFNYDVVDINNIKSSIVEANRKKIFKVSKERKDYKSNRIVDEEAKRLPPNILNNDKIVLENGKLILKTNF